METSQSCSRIAELNDQFRKTGIGGKILVTQGIQASWPDYTAIIGKVKAFDAFDDSNDPWKEHDFGKIEHEEQSVYWKISYYDKDVHYGSPDPADPSVTTRVMTIMLAEEY
ncbi:MAG: DUF3768 domain-containing protein [Candidatus Competibacteraceae bacterium]|jgi:hypothetical protein|nr:DUF3768 domain-containing protein [Candidatus Competibacteraceae bacterium]